MPAPLRGPRGLPLIGSLHALSTDTLGFLTHAGHDFGDISKFRMVTRDAFMLNHPRHIEALLVGQYRHCIKDIATRSLMALVGQGLLTSEGDFWRRQRKLAAPTLQPRRIATYAETMVQCTERLAATFRDNEVRDIHTDMMRLTLDIVSRTLFSADTSQDGPKIGDALDVVMDYFVAELWSYRRFLPPWVPLAGRRRFREAVADLDRVIYEMIRRHRMQEVAGDDLLSRLMHARDEDGQQMSDEQLRDEAITMVLAGHETTALALTFAWFLLSEQRDVSARLLAEVHRELDGRSPTLEDLPKLRYADAVVREVLRLYPPAYVIGREATADIDLDGHLIRTGDQILISQWAVQRNPRFFPEPERFRPERWLEPEAEALPRFAYFPFGGGARVCIGNHFAMMEAILILTTLLQRVDLTVVPGTRLELSPSITLRPGGPIRVIVQRRTPDPSVLLKTEKTAPLVHQ